MDESISNIVFESDAVYMKPNPLYAGGEKVHLSLDVSNNMTVTLLETGATIFTFNLSEIVEYRTLRYHLAIKTHTSSFGLNFLRYKKLTTATLEHSLGSASWIFFFQRLKQSPLKPVFDQWCEILRQKGLEPVQDVPVQAIRRGLVTGLAVFIILLIIVIIIAAVRSA